MDKYYTPEITDLRIGYECEMNDALGYKEDYVKIVIDKDVLEAKAKNRFEASSLSDIIDMINDGYGEIRTPYLTKEQIEAEGWKHFDIKNNHFIKGIYKLLYKTNSNELQIVNTDSSYGWQILFVGECKSINEFRYICSLLKI